VVTSAMCYKVYGSKDQKCSYLVIEKSQYDGYCRNIKILGLLKKYKRKPNGFINLQAIENKEKLHLYQMS